MKKNKQDALNKKIVNVSAVTNKDIKYLISLKERTDKTMILSRIAFELGGIALIVFAIKDIITAQNHDLKFYLLNFLFIILGIYLSVIDIFVSRALKFKAQTKNYITGQERIFTFNQDGILNIVIDDGFTMKHKYKDLDKGYVHNDTLYLHFKNSLRYLTIHSDGMYEGTFTELIGLLESHQIIIKGEKR